MNFIVDYRDGTGKTVRKGVEAPNRAAAFAALKAEGISPLRLTEGVYSAPSAAGRRPSTLWRGAAAGVLVAVLGGVAVYFLMPGASEPKAPKEEKMPRVQVSIPARTNAVPVARKPPAAKPERIKPVKALTPAERIFAETNGMSTGRLAQWKFEQWKGPVITSGVTRVKTLEEKVFKNPAERFIGGLLRLQPGAMMIGDSRALYNASFLKAFKASLEEPIIIDAEDTEEVAELKRSVQDAKEELRKRMDAGEDVCQIMVDTREEYRKLGLYRDDLKKQVSDLLKDGKLSSEDMDDLVKAANVLLEERGAKPITLPVLYKHRIKQQLNQENKAKSEKGNE